MKLADLIDRLIEIQNKKSDYNPEVSVMMEHTQKSLGDIQVQSTVRDVATCGDCLIIIGEELE